MLAAKGAPKETQDLVGWLLAQGRASDMAWVPACALVAAGAVNFELGRFEAVRELLRDLVSQRIIDSTELKQSPRRRRKLLLLLAPGLAGDRSPLRRHPYPRPWPSAAIPASMQSETSVYGLHT